jgi:hypothetical protein
MVDVYHKAPVFFIKEMREELSFEIMRLNNDPLKKDSVWKDYQPRADDFILEKQMEVLSFCSYLIGDRAVVPVNFSIKDLQYCLGAVGTNSYRNNLGVYASYILFVAKSLAGEKLEDLEFEDVRALVCCPEYLSVSAYAGTQSATFTLKSGDVAKDSFFAAGIGRLLRYYLCFDFPKGSVDELLGYVGLANMESDNYALRKAGVFSSDAMPLIIQGIYCDVPKDKITLAYFDVDKFLDEELKPYWIEGYAVMLTQLLNVRRYPLGPVTSRIFKYLATEARYKDTFSKLFSYLTQALSNPTIKDDITVSATEAFKPQHKWYVTGLDVGSQLFKAVEDDSGVDDSSLDFVPYDPSSDPNNIDISDDNDDDEDQDDDDDVDDIIYDPDSQSKDTDTGSTPENTDGLAIGAKDTDPKSSNDDGGYKLTLPDPDTLDSYTYRSEALFIIERVLANDASGISAEDKLLLKRLKAQWLFVINVEVVHEILERVLGIQPSNNII